MADTSCPCGSSKMYAHCCQPLMDGVALAHTPEQLMRSRYSAFHRGAIDYLISTHHPSRRQPNDRQTLAKTMAETEWLSLRVLQAAGNTVEFVAFYKYNDVLHQVHEKSTFVYEDGHWYYQDGIHLDEIQLGRNDPCWCGSGKKLKKCHGP